MMVPVIFLGPSLSVERAREIFPLADYRPPARKGDFQRLLTKDVKLVGLIDGVFLQDYPPTPSEVHSLLTKNNNLIVAGAASLGALRAVELEKFGMIGIGKIFMLYRRGLIDSDDEVAVTYSDTTYKLESEALIDIRYTVFHALREGVIDNETRKIIIRTAKNIYFPNRTYEEIFQKVKGKVSETVIEHLSRYTATNRRSLKEKDAVRLVQFLMKRYFSSLNGSTEQRHRS